MAFEFPILVLAGRGERQVAVSTYRQALSALLFLYQKVFGRSNKARPGHVAALQSDAERRPAVC